jgi:hypothetical protein
MRWLHLDFALVIVCIFLAVLIASGGRYTSLYNYFIAFYLAHDISLQAQKINLVAAVYYCATGAVKLLRMRSETDGSGDDESDWFSQTSSSQTGRSS